MISYCFLKVSLICVGFAAFCCAFFNPVLLHGYLYDKRKMAFGVGEGPYKMARLIMAIRLLHGDEAIFLGCLNGVSDLCFHSILPSLVSNVPSGLGSENSTSQAAPASSIKIDLGLGLYGKLTVLISA